MLKLKMCLEAAIEEEGRHPEKMEEHFNSSRVAEL
jgi:hypothetical protein